MNTGGSVLLDTNIAIAHFRNDIDLTAQLRTASAFTCRGSFWANSLTGRALHSGVKRK
jgi:predicted nucleic acid-binding protein